MCVDSIALKRLRRGNVIYGAVMGFLIVLLTAGGANAIALFGLHKQLVAEGRDNAQFLAASVSRTLGRRLERAAMLDIPLNALPDLDQSIRQTISRVAGISAITVMSADEEIIATVTADNSKQVDVINKVIRADGEIKGYLLISTSPIMLSEAFQTACSRSAAIVLLLAVLASFAGGRIAKDLSKEQLRLFNKLMNPTTKNAWQEDYAEYLPSNDAIENAWRAIHAQEIRTQSDDAALHCYAAELLSIDFSGSVRPRVFELASIDASSLTQAVHAPFSSTRM